MRVVEEVVLGLPRRRMESTDRRLVSGRRRAVGQTGLGRWLLSPAESLSRRRRISPDTARLTAPPSEPFSEAAELSTPRAEVREYMEDTLRRLASSEKEVLDETMAGSGSRWRLSAAS